MKLFKYLGVVILIFFSCRTEKSLLSFQGDKDKDLKEQEYFRNFTDAIKQELNGNYRAAILLYSDCIRKFPKNAAPYYQLSNIFLKAQDFETAKSYAVVAESLNSNNIWYKLHLANLYQYENKNDSAILLYKELVELDKNPEYIYNLALLYSQNEQENESLEMLKLLEKEYDGSKEIYLFKHNLYNNLKEYDSAVNELNILIKSFPEAYNYGILAEYLTEIGRSEQAKKMFREAVNSDSTNGLVLLSFGDLYLKNNDNDSAFLFYKKAFEYGSLDSDSKINLIVNFLKNKDFTHENSDNILTLLNNLNIDKSNFIYYAVYADFYSNILDYQQSVAYMDSALTLKKDNYFLWEQSILISNYLKNYNDVVRKVEECQKEFGDKENLLLVKAYAEHSILKDSNAIATGKYILKISDNKESKVQALNLLGEIYREGKLYQKSDSCFEEILKIDNENLMIRNNYSYYLSLREENLDRAFELISYTVNKEPQNATYLDTYGWVLFKLGKFKEAKNYIESSIRFGAYNNAEVLDHYGEVMLKLGKCQESIEAWERVIEIDSSYSVVEKLNIAKENCK